MHDIIIIGAGVVGAMIARKLSRYNLDVLVIDKENDVGNVVSNANSAIVHSGYDPKPGTLKAKLNVLGNKAFPLLCKELDIPFKQIGSLTVTNSNEGVNKLYELAEQSKLNGVEVKVLEKDELFKVEPNLQSDILAGLLAPSCGIVDPFLLSVRVMENAVDNGVKLHLDECVTDIKKIDGGFNVITNKDKYDTKIVINAAGLYSDVIASMVEDIDWKMIPRKGEYYIFATTSFPFVNHVVFPLPTEKGKGVLVSQTTSGNTIIGPTSEEVIDKDDVSTDTLTLLQVQKSACSMVKVLPFPLTIRTFSGIRPTTTRHDFIIEPSKKYKEFINVAGIESPGLVSSPAIADYVVDNYIYNIIKLEEKPNYISTITRYHHIDKMDRNEANKLIKNHPSYGDVICNCEQVSYGELEEILSSSVPPRTIKGIKRRLRIGYGRCQGGYCHPKLVMYLAKYWNIDPKDIIYDKDDSFILKEEVKVPHHD